MNIVSTVRTCPSSLLHSPLKVNETAIFFFCLSLSLHRSVLSSFLNSTQSFVRACTAEIPDDHIPSYLRVMMQWMQWAVLRQSRHAWSLSAGRVRKKLLRNAHQILCVLRKVYIFLWCILNLRYTDKWRVQELIKHK